MEDGWELYLHCFDWLDAFSMVEFAGVHKYLDIVPGDGEIRRFLVKFRCICQTRELLKTSI